MAPAMDLSQSTHAKMIVSPPRLNLRRTASYQHEKGTGAFSATSSRFNFNHLIFSPPPSPGLPALVPRPRKSSNTPRPSRVLRFVAWIAGIAVVLYVAGASLKGQVPAPLDWALEDHRQYEMVGEDDLPDFPTPIAVADRHGKSKWTVSIPPTARFPLSVSEYSDICAKCQEVAAHVRELRGSGSPSQQAQLGYYHDDPYFVDVSEAEKRGLLPGVEGKAWTVTARAQEGHLLGADQDGPADKETCKTSLTFVLESPDAGLGNTLMMLWMAYGLAKKERRSFFVDDSRWAYGKYTDMFKEPPTTGCSPPPRHEMVPCPHQARHLIVSGATARETFGTSFIAEYERPRRNDASRDRPMYDLARAGFEALFHLNSEDEPYVASRVNELRAKSKVAEGKTDGTIVGVHVRHGDLHPYEYQYNGAYIPLNIYAEKAREILEESYNASGYTGEHGMAIKQHSFTVLASDDPLVYESDEFSHSLRAQEQIKLASKQQETHQPAPNKHVMHKFVDETFGWEGGFFATMFWNLGRPSHVADGTQTALEPSAETMRLRGLIGRAYVMDLAVLGQASDTVICTMSAMACRLLAVIMGWEKSMDDGKWVNIDGNYQWTGLSL